MNKSFREILAERDDEFTYHVRSTADIHHPELFERIRLSFLPYDIRSFECDTYRPIGKHNKHFPDEPNSPCYSIKLTTGLPVPHKFIESLAADAHIHVAHLRIDGDDQDHDLVNQPEEVSASVSQMMVGQKRLGEFVRELEAERKKRMGMTTEREVYETFCMTHRGLEDVLNKPMRKGYYMIEAYQVDGSKYFDASGPFATRPHANYFDRLRLKNAKIISEGTIGDTYGISVLIEGSK